MIRTIFNNLPNPKVKFEVSPSFLSDNKRTNSKLHQVSINSLPTNQQLNTKIKYFFARRVTTVGKPIQEIEKTLIAQTTTPTQIQQEQQKVKVPYFKPTQNYTFTDLDKDLQMYQEYLKIFNTHTKKAHEKLVRNEIKIIQCIIEAKRQDLLNKFLSTNYRNRLANPQTLITIQNYYMNRIHSSIDSIIASKEECQSLLQTISLMNEYNEPESFNVFLEEINKKHDLDPIAKNKENYLLKVLENLPSRQCQFLLIYNWLIRQKQLPLYVMQSSWLGIHTENLKFHNLGETFYEIRKFVRRYFAIYSKKLEVEEEGDPKELKNLQRQFNKTTKASSLEDDVACFLKALNYQNVRRQIQIDGFVVDFVIDNVKNHTTSPIQTQQTSQPTSTILQVMGSYHYTSRNKLKIRDVRKLVLLGSKYRQNKYVIKLIHYDDLNKSRGFRNKMALIKSILQSQSQEINWQPCHKGFESNWQLKEHYQEFK